MKWISIKNELPFQHQKVITLEDYTGSIPANEEISGADFIDGKFWYDYHSDYPVMLDNVTHWMHMPPMPPLQEPPEE